MPFILWVYKWSQVCYLDFIKMFKIQLCVSLAFLAVVFGNPAQNVVDYDCARLRPIIVTPEEVAGEWFGLEIYKNIGVGNRHVDASTMCLAANVTAVNSTHGGHEHLIIAEKDKKYLTVAFCATKPGLTFTPVQKIVTYRYGGQPDLTPAELRVMHDVIKSTLSIERLQVGKLQCRTHGKH
ncbi:hypothetical protein B566_EDAN003937 [Ephemera danica]|nr:hypothetical protein B566_EDAN003937 [Ephemera danica]